MVNESAHLGRLQNGRKWIKAWSKSLTEKPFGPIFPSHAVNFPSLSYHSALGKSSLCIRSTERSPIEEPYLWHLRGNKFPLPLPSFSTSRQSVDSNEFHLIGRSMRAFQLWTRNRSTSDFRMIWRHTGRFLCDWLIFRLITTRYAFFAYKGFKKPNHKPYWPLNDADGKMRCICAWYLLIYGMKTGYGVIFQTYMTEGGNEKTTKVLWYL